jgi:hypothetical protein
MVACLGVGIAVLAQSGKQNLPIENRTASLTVDSAVTVSNQNGAPAVAFRITNKGKKAILAYKASINGSNLLKEFFAPQRTALPPGEADTGILAPADSNGADLTQQTFRLWAAVFADASGEGDPASVDELKTLREGRLLASRRMQPILDALSNEVQSDSTGANGAGAISRSIERLEALPQEDSSGKPATGLLASGFQGAVAAVTYELGSVIENHLPPHSMSAAVAAIIRSQSARRESFEEFFRLSGATIR